MKKTYQIKINQGKDTKALDIPMPGVKGQAITVKALAGARYQLIDTETGFGPENIRTSRQGKDLKVSFEGSNTTDLVIEDYYKVSPEGYNGLIGEAESGRFYEYIPENALGMSSVPMLAESGPVVGMALGGAEVAPAGAAVGLLAAGLFSPWLLGAGALGVAAAAGGAGGAKDTTPPAGQTGALAAVSDSGIRDNVTNVTKPTIVGKVEPGASAVEIYFRDPSGKLTGPYKPDSVDESGNFSLKVPDTLVDFSGDTKGTKYTPVVKVTDTSGNSSSVDGTPFVVDTKTPDLTLTIDADTNNDGLITVIENGNSNQKSDLKVTASFDKAKANVGDEIHFQLPGGEDQKVTLTQAMLDAGKAGISFLGLIVDKALLKVSSWFVDTSLNQGSTLTDTALVDLSVAVHVTSIAADDMINAAESTAMVTVKGTASANGSISLIVGSTEVGQAVVSSDGTWISQVDGLKFKDAASLTAKLTAAGATVTDSHVYKYDTNFDATVTSNTSAKTNTLQGVENVAYKLLSDDVWVALPKDQSKVLSDNVKFFMSDVSGNLYGNYSGLTSSSKVVEYGAINKQTNPTDLTVAQLLSVSDVFQIDDKTLAVKSVSLSDGKANTLNVDLLDVLNHGVLDVLHSGLGAQPQFRIDSDVSGDTLNLTNKLGGLGGWSAKEMVTFGGHSYTHYSGYSLGLEVDLLVDKNIAVHIL
jgi:hypothetical protein